MKAHSEQDYIASIPILLPHIEAIFIDFLMKNGLLVNEDKKLQGNDVLNALKMLQVDLALTEVDKIFFRRFVNQKGIYDYRGENEYLNRGKVLHGMSLNYDQEEWSAQIIYLLDFICEFTGHTYDLTEDRNGKKLLSVKHRVINLRYELTHDSD